MSSLATRLLAIIAALRRAVAQHVAEQARGPLVVLLGTQVFVSAPLHPRHPPLPAETWPRLLDRLARLAARVQSLFARWHAGTLAPPRPSRAGAPRRAAAPYPRLPATRGWINARIAAAAPCAGDLCLLVQDPAMPEFIAEVPRALRLLRPLCRALAIDLPPALARPRPVRRPAPPPAPAAATASPGPAPPPPLRENPA